MDLCIDIGATKTFVAIFDEGVRQIHVSDQFLTESSKGFDHFLERLTTLCTRLLKGEKPRFWGICTAGAVNKDGVVLWSPNLGWKNLPLKELMIPIFGEKGIIENDCNAAAYAEARVRDVENLAYVTLSTGIGMGIVVNKKIYQGSHFSAGEIGHTIVDQNGPMCSCGRRGCLQAIASGRGLENQIFEITGQKVDCATILNYAQDGMEPYHTIVRRASLILGKLLTNVVDILDVDTIVLGGGLTKNEYYTNMVVEFIVKNYYRLSAKIVNVERTIYQLNSGVMGMIFLIRDLFGGVDAC